jgi:transposase-like protein
MVAESYAPGAVVSEVARQNDISPQRLSSGARWREPVAELASRSGRIG